MTQNTMETVKTTLMPPLLPGGLMPGLVSVVPVDCGAEDVKAAPPDRMICQSQPNIIAAQAAEEDRGEGDFDGNDEMPLAPIDVVT
jgi:hypothetical protein